MSTYVRAARFRDRVLGAMIGAAIGDALGSAFEFVDSASIARATSATTESFAITKRRCRDRSSRPARPESQPMIRRWRSASRA